ncbi:MbtH family NRPS accessory protein [Plantactinospora sp. KBS50]|uniref:MbtH family NRPS accessory protein n=1 Tax=Plantactinospora sp. KBS50 TaxID=2024580 RepID=UPI000BAAD3C6|nr:MbtH family NRPS accessory protein [Plantactinospora sp. KBS50]ASW54626.1 hypothetical protein CIK06_11200 [Plantactinospora sp. KBS50]
MIVIDQFDDPTATFRVVLDTDGRPSVRSDHLPLPPGWTALHRPDDFQGCSDYLTRYLARRPVADERPEGGHR